MNTRRPTVDFEELRRIAYQVRIDTLNAIDELVIRTMSEGKDVEPLSRRVKKALESKMDEAAETRLRTWFIRYSL